MMPLKLADDKVATVAGELSRSRNRLPGGDSGEIYSQARRTSEAWDGRELACDWRAPGTEDLDGDEQEKAINAIQLSCSLHDKCFP